MHAASRTALKHSIEHLEKTLKTAANPEVDSARVGTELFDCARVLDGDRSLRVAMAEASTTGTQRAGLARDVFEGKIDALSLEVLLFAAKQTWSTPAQMRAGLVELGRRALLYAAETSGVLDRVENELFEIARLLEREPELTTHLSDRTATPVAKRSLLAAVLYGKVSAVTEALVLQAVARREHGPIADIAALSELAAEVRGKKIARVTAATPMTAEQEQELAAKLAKIYNAEMVIHSEVDPSLIGGALVRVGSEVIDGTTAGKIERLRTSIA